MNKKSTIFVTGYAIILFVALIGSMFFWIYSGVNDIESAPTLLPVYKDYLTNIPTMVTSYPTTKKVDDQFFETSDYVETAICTDGPETEILDPLPTDGTEDNVTVLPPTYIPNEKESFSVTVYLTKQDKSIEIDMEEYVTGVLSGEMSYSQNVEALKAQAVVARSYYLKRTTYKNPGHPVAPVCDDPNHCMTYIGYDEYIEKYGKEQGDYMWNIYRCAAMSCAGEYITYKGNYIDAMCHSSSYKSTESYYNVYGENYSYLSSVPSPENAETQTFIIGIAQIIECLFDDKTISDAKSPLGEIVRSEDSGRVSEIFIYGVCFKGTYIRSALGLSSTCFTVEYNNGNYIFTCYGRGHGIGLSQHGAYALANSGMTYRDIVLHYFSGCELQTEIN